MQIVMRVITNTFYTIAVKVLNKILLKSYKIVDYLFSMVKMMMKLCLVELCLLYKELNGKGKWKNFQILLNKFGKKLIILVI